MQPRKISLYRLLRLFQIGILTLIMNSGRSQVWYDGTLGTTPDAQGWSYGALAFGPITKTATNNSVLLDTTSTTQISAGWTLLAAPPLDRSAGLALAFTARVNTEAHSNNNRAGFSVIVLDSHTNGIELAFWGTNIFAQSDSPLFTHAEDVTFVTTNALIDYVLTLLPTRYVLHANGTAILSGPIRDYTAFNGVINPYRTPNFVFFGDDTTSAAASVSIGRVALIRPPTLSSPIPGILAWSGVRNTTYTIQASSNLTSWATVGIATSSSDNFNFTNPPSPQRVFFRVAFP